MMGAGEAALVENGLGELFIIYFMYVMNYTEGTKAASLSTRFKL